MHTLVLIVLAYYGFSEA